MQWPHEDDTKADRDTWQESDIAGSGSRYKYWFEVHFDNRWPGSVRILRSFGHHHHFDGHPPHHGRVPGLARCRLVRFRCDMTSCSRSRSADRDPSLLVNHLRYVRKARRKSPKRRPSDGPTAFQLFFGKLYFLFNVKAVFLAAVFIFELGSLMCGVASNSTTLIVGVYLIQGSPHC